MRIESWDSHMHLHPFRPEWWAERLIANMDRNRVRGGALSGVGLFNPEDTARLQALARRYPGRFLPMLSHIDLNDPDELERAIALLDTGEWAGVGELFLEAHSSSHLTFVKNGETVKQPYPVPRDGAHNAVLGGLVRYCRERALPILIHSESAAALEDLLALYPESTLLWAHCDYVTPLNDVQRVFRRYPWLRVDFGPMIRCGYWDSQNGSSSWIETDRPFWRSLCRAFAPRLLLGTDTIQEKYCEPDRYKHIYDSYADFLAPLDPRQVEQIMAGNFKRVFRAYLQSHGGTESRGTSKPSIEGGPVRNV